EVAELLDPVGVEDILAGVEAPAPGVVDGGEEGAAGAVAAEDEDGGLSAVGGGGGGVLGVDLADAGLDLHALAEPEDGLDLVLEEVLVLRAVLVESEDGGLQAVAGELGAEAVLDGGGLALGDAGDEDGEELFEGVVLVAGGGVAGAGDHA